MRYGEKGDLLHGQGHTVGRISTQPIFSYLQGSDMSYMLKQTKIIKGMHS
jgi:hypothetical protein